MKDKMMQRWGTIGTTYSALLGERKIADIVITNHARTRWMDRVESKKTGFEDISSYLWKKLKEGSIRSYYKNEQDVYLIEGDLVMVAEFVRMDKSEGGSNQSQALYKMIVVTFLGRMSETIELRNLKSYYSWLRHSRRMTLMKNARKRR